MEYTTNPHDEGKALIDKPILYFDYKFGCLFIAEILGAERGKLGQNNLMKRRVSRSQLFTRKCQT